MAANRQTQTSPRCTSNALIKVSLDTRKKKKRFSARTHEMDLHHSHQRNRAPGDVRIRKPCDGHLRPGDAQAENPTREISARQFLCSRGMCDLQAASHHHAHHSHLLPKRKTQLPKQPNGKKEDGCVSKTIHHAIEHHNRQQANTRPFSDGKIPISFDGPADVKKWERSNGAVNKNNDKKGIDDGPLMSVGSAGESRVKDQNRKLGKGNGHAKKCPQNRSKLLKGQSLISATTLTGNGEEWFGLVTFMKLVLNKVNGTSHRWRPQPNRSTVNINKQMRRKEKDGRDPFGHTYKLGTLPKRPRLGAGLGLVSELP